MYWQLNGSLLVKASNAMGSVQNSGNDAEGILQYGVGCGRCRLHGVKIKNKGVDWRCENNVYWQHQVQRLETLEINLEGNAEFEAFDVLLEVSIPSNPLCFLFGFYYSDSEIVISLCSQTHLKKPGLIPENL